MSSAAESTAPQAEPDSDAAAAESTTRTSDGCAPTLSALPTPIIDRIRDGVSRNGRRETIWSEVRRTAASAQQHGWDFPDWAALIMEATSKLGTQLRVRSGKARPERQVHRDLAKAWDAAAKWVKTAPPAAAVEDEITERIEAVHELIDSGQLDHAQTAVLKVAVKFAEYHHTTRPAMPRRETETLTGLGSNAVRTAHRRLHDAGLLTLAQRGRAGTNRLGTGSGRASLYHLPARGTAYQYLENQVCGSVVQVCGSGDPPADGSVVQVCGSVTQPKAPPDASKAMRRFDGATYPYVARIRPDGSPASIRVRNCGPLLAAAQVAAQKAIREYRPDKLGEEA